MKILNLTSTILSALILTTSLASASMPGKPFTGNPGECPMYVQGCPDDKPHDPIQCNTDFDCEPNHKCCGTPCFGRTCIVSTVQKAGECEDPKRELADCAADAYNNSHADCSHDFQCSGEYKCCPQTCVKPRCALPKLTCPPVCAIACTYGQVLDSNGCPTCSCNPNPCESQACGVDQHCEVQNVQCVRAPCPPQAVCVDNDSNEGVNDVVKSEVTVNPGYCPQYAPGPGCEGRPSDPIECNNDLDCEPNHKCCGTPCSGRRCEASWVGLKAGECEDPKREVSQCLSCQYENSTRECSHDGQCPGDEKCCPQTCVKPRCALPKPACPPVCKIYCEFGNVLDTNDCPTCSCKPNPCEVVDCGEDKHCELQNVQCIKAPCYPVATCVDNKPKECPPVCTVFCEFGYVLDANNCPTCICKPNPCTLVDCAANKSCEVQNVQCFTAPCDPIAVCVDKTNTCPPTCKIRCEYGNVLDENLCPTCQCVEPCKDKVCGAGEVCQVQNVQCVKAPCYPIGVCAKPRPTNPERIPELVCPEPENACPTGQRRLTCADDSGCGDKKCCSTGCGHNICLPPVRAGSCPKKDPFALCGPHSADESVDKCGSDHVCPGAQKCCPFVCPGYGLRCQEPVY